MIGSKYAISVAQLEYRGTLHPDAHMFFIKTLQEEQQYFMASIMAHLSPKAGFKWWVTKAHKDVQSETNQLYFRETFNKCI